MSIVLATVTLTSTTFASNSAYLWNGGFGGGGMYISRDSSEVTLRQCSFINNTASDKGHAIYTYS